MLLNISHNITPTSNILLKVYLEGKTDSFSADEKEFLKENKGVKELNSFTNTTIYVQIPSGSSTKQLEVARLLGHTVFQSIKKQVKVSINSTDSSPIVIAFIEGLFLSSYQFDKYKTEKETSTEFELTHLDTPEIAELIKTIHAVFETKNLVNEPPNKLTSQSFINRIADFFQNTTISSRFLSLEEIEKLNMNGLLAVNAASSTPPQFAICEYKPESFKNKQPIILVGKGVVYDTGGLSLKPTQNSMDIMKCDMAGAATVLGALKTAHDNHLPLHLICITPITDNLIGPNAFAPGDVLTMANGKTVEVMDTDAEGRLILADALIYAQQYKPELVIDVATLTGSAARAIGKEGIVYMGTCSKEIKQKLEISGDTTFERLVEFPLWEEYFEQIKSPIADIKNLGGSEAGAITAGKFLEQFIDYDWMHLDIAGPSFTTSPYNYRGTGATGCGVRLIYDFLKNY